MYVIQRDDIACFQLSAGDAIYQDTVDAAKAAGVEFISINTRYELTNDPETGKMRVKCLFDKEVVMK
jgi:DNA-binding sugar fermentation-stimulating protein